MYKLNNKLELSSVQLLRTLSSVWNPSVAFMVRLDYSLFDNIPIVKQWFKENESKYKLKSIEPVDEIK